MMILAPVAERVMTRLAQPNRLSLHRSDPIGSRYVLCVAPRGPAAESLTGRLRINSATLHQRDGGRSRPLAAARQGV
jgi:hypothetical protein